MVRRKFEAAPRCRDCDWFRDDGACGRLGRVFFDPVNGWQSERCRMEDERKPEGRCGPGGRYWQPAGGAVFEEAQLVGPACRDCGHRRGDACFSPSVVSLDPVTGEERGRTCISMRQASGDCGIEGRRWMRRMTWRARVFGALGLSS